eukprot:6463952-Amphidinium_carterae.1
MTQCTANPRTLRQAEVSRTITERMLSPSRVVPHLRTTAAPCCSKMSAAKSTGRRGCFPTILCSRPKAGNLDAPSTQLVNSSPLETKLIVSIRTVQFNSNRPKTSFIDTVQDHHCSIMKLERDLELVTLSQNMKKGILHMQTHTSPSLRGTARQPARHQVVKRESKCVLHEQQMDAPDSALPSEPSTPPPAA